uniref:Uncharacterized protein n=1 Tax=Clastoptera arizonana TaxID=38151 RepID=A0A1B6DRN8_9HEMI
MPPESKQISSIKPNFKYFDILTLKPDSSDVVKSVPKPKEALVKNGLPKWNNSTLDTKLPLLPGPNGPFVFSRGKLGKNLWKNKVQSEFTLNDPNGYEVTFEYEPAHDKHLKRWFAVTNNQKYLLKNDIVTENLDVKCSVKQYNEYRKYLHRIHSNQVCKEMKQKEENAVDKMVLRNGYKSLNKEMTKLRTKQGQTNSRQKNVKKIQNEEEAKRKDCLRRLKRVTETNTRLEQSKKENLKKSIERSRAKNAKVQSRIENANEIERKRIIQFLRKKNEADIKRKQDKEEEENRRKAEIAQKAKERWEKKFESQQKQIEKEDFLRKQRKMDLELSKLIRMNKCQTRLAGLQEKIILTKSKPTILQVNKKFKKKQKGILEAIQANVLSENSEKCSDDVKALKLMENKIQNIMNNLYKDMDTYFLITEAKARLVTDLPVPIPVLNEIQFLIKGSIWISLSKKLEPILYAITHKIFYELDKITHPDKPSVKKSIKIMPSQLITASSNKEDMEKKFQKVSFGSQSLVSVKSEIKLDLKRIKDRKPTRVPSIKIISVAALADPTVENYTPLQVFTEQKMLKKYVDHLKLKLLNDVEGRVKNVVQSAGQSTIKVSESTNKIKYPYPLVRLCNLILFSEEDDFTSILDTIVIDVLRDVNLLSKKDN